ncbi:hypothetical protein DXG01_011051 [Tephrocybe rancida]|nr:hypothetical protein DXG01_011051 [Tephrocybe rancida]
MSTNLKLLLNPTEEARQRWESIRGLGSVPTPKSADIRSLEKITTPSSTLTSEQLYERMERQARQIRDFMQALVFIQMDFNTVVARICAEYKTQLSDSADSSALLFQTSLMKFAGKDLDLRFAAIRLHTLGFLATYPGDAAKNAVFGPPTHNFTSDSAQGFGGAQAGLRLQELVKYNAPTSFNLEAVTPTASPVNPVPGSHLLCNVRYKCTKCKISNVVPSSINVTLNSSFVLEGIDIGGPLASGVVLEAPSAPSLAPVEDGKGLKWSFFKGKTSFASNIAAGGSVHVSSLESPVVPGLRKHVSASNIRDATRLPTSAPSVAPVLPRIPVSDISLPTFSIQGPDSELRKSFEGLDALRLVAAVQMPQLPGGGKHLRRIGW